MKRFFYASGAILCIVLSYHFGATNAQAQAGAYFTQIGDGYVVVGETVYHPTNSGWAEASSNDIPPGVSPSDIIWTNPGSVVITRTGEGWILFGSTGWNDIGTVPGGGATPTVRHTLGQLKARYR